MAFLCSVVFGRCALLCLLASSCGSSAFSVVEWIECGGCWIGVHFEAGFSRICSYLLLKSTAFLFVSVSLLVTSALLFGAKRFGM